MVTYEITAEVREDLAESYEMFMRERHIPDLLATGCFVAATLSRSGVGRYRIRYEAPDQASLDRYLATEAPRLRADLAAQFPVGVGLTREVWTVVQSWPATPRASA